MNDIVSLRFKTMSDDVITNVQKDVAERILSDPKAAIEAWNDVREFATHECDYESEDGLNGWGEYEWGSDAKLSVEIYKDYPVAKEFMVYVDTKVTKEHKIKTELPIDELRKEIVKWVETGKIDPEAFTLVEVGNHEIELTRHVEEMDDEGRDIGCCISGTQITKGGTFFEVDWRSIND